MLPESKDFYHPFIANKVIFEKSPNDIIYGIFEEVQEKGEDKTFSEGRQLTIPKQSNLADGDIVKVDGVSYKILTIVGQESWQSGDNTGDMTVMLGKVE